jgi:hypothetical protein
LGRGRRYSLIIDPAVPLQEKTAIIRDIIAPLEFGLLEAIGCRYADQALAIKKHVSCLRAEAKYTTMQDFIGYCLTLNFG